MSVFKPYTVKLYGDGMGAAVVFTDMTQLDVSVDLQMEAKPTAAVVSPNHVAANERNCMVKGTSFDLKGILDAIGVSGLGFTAATNPGLVAYFQKFSDVGDPVAGSNHRSFSCAAVGGIIVPKSLSCEHRGNAQITFESLLLGDGTNAPFALSDTAALPTITAASVRWTLGKIVLGGVTFTENIGLEIDFGNAIEGRGAASYLDSTHVEQRTHSPVITLTGIDPLWFAAAKVPIGGLAVVTATDRVYLKKRTQTGTTFTPDITAEHIRFSLAGLAGVQNAAQAQAQRMSETTLRIVGAIDGSGNNPLIVSTAAAIA